MGGAQPQAGTPSPPGRGSTGRRPRQKRRGRRSFDSPALAQDDITDRKKGGFSVKFARRCAGLGAVLSAGITLALVCEQLAGLLDKALMI